MHWSKRLVLAASVASLCWTTAPTAPTDAFAQTQRGQNQGLCRRAPSPIVLPPEREQQVTQNDVYRRRGGVEGRAVPPPSAAPPPPPPPPPPSAAPGASDGITASRRAPSTSSPEARAPVAEDERAAGSAFEYRDRPRQPTPRAGLLTAGDHDDLLNPELYAQYVDNFLSRERLEGVPRVDTARVLSIIVRDNSGRAVPFAAVTLTCADGNRLSLNTTADGSAVFFPELDRLGRNVSVSVRHAGQVTQGRAVSLSGGAGAQEQTVRVSAAATAVRRFDLALVVDTTGSMSDELEYLKSELRSILGELNRRHPGLDIRVGLVVYRDEGDQYITRTFPLTSNIESLRTNLARQSADGGGDYPEAVEQAMARAMALDWRDNAVRSILFVADAPPHADDIAATWRSAEVARANRIQIVPVGASGVGDGAEYVMRAMAAVTQSRYVFLTDDSGIGNPHAPPAIDCYNVTSLESQIRRALDDQISGRRSQPDNREIIRTVGESDNGRCILPPNWQRRGQKQLQEIP